MGRKWIILLLILVVFLGGCSSSASASSPAAKFVSGVVRNVVSTVFKWLWSFKSSTSKSKTATTSRSMMKFESGYTVETVFDGSKLGIEPYTVEVSPTGELLILDSENSNIYRISTPSSRHSRPKLVAGSTEGYTGHVDGRLREARMNHPKGITTDDRGNIYVADTANMAIRKISDYGVVTIAGGKLGRHVDGPSEDAKFSNDFDVVFVGCSCSLLVVDRGNKAIREIQLDDDDCLHRHEDNLHYGPVVIAATVFFGYMLALLQRWVGAILSNNNEPKAYVKTMPAVRYQGPPLQSVRPPLISAEDEYEKQEDGLFCSIGRIFHNAGSTIFGGLFTGSKRKPPLCHEQYHYPPTSWPMQESFVVPREDEPPPIEPTPRKSYLSMTRDVDKTRHHRQSRGNRNRTEFLHQQQRHVKQLQHQHKHQAPGPDAFYEQQNYETDEIVFGAVQEQDRWHKAVVVKPLDYGDTMYSSNRNIRSRYNNYMGYSSNGY